MEQQLKNSNPSPDPISLESLGDRPSTYKPKALEKKYNEFFTYSFGPIVVLVLWWITQDLDKASFYAPSPDECQGIAPHAARIVDRFSKWAKIPAEVHEFITTSDDTLALAYVVTGYLSRIGVLERLGPSFMGLFIRKGNTIAKPDEPVAKHNAKVPTPIYSPKPAADRVPGNSQSLSGAVPVSAIPGLGSQWSS